MAPLTQGCDEGRPARSVMPIAMEEAEGGHARTGLSPPSTPADLPCALPVWILDPDDRNVPTPHNRAAKPAGIAAQGALIAAGALQALVEGQERKDPLATNDQFNVWSVVVPTRPLAADHANAQ